jgi:lauroyl/myristoyl acyltransferase
MKFYDLYLLTVIALIKIADYCCFVGVKEFFPRAIAFAAYHLSRRRGRLRELALSQAVQVAGPELRSIVKHSFYVFWQDVFVASSLSRKSGHIDAVVRGLEHLKKALRQGHGVILWESSFFGGRVLAKRILHENGFSVCQVHSEFHIGGFRHTRTRMSRHVIQPFFENRERPFVRELLPLSRSDSIAFTRELLARLKDNQIICIAGDGAMGHKFIPIEFLGRIEPFSTGMVSLARVSGAPILPLFCLQENGDGATLVIEPAIRTEIDGDRELSLKKALRQYATVLNYYVKKYPKQYRNWHGLARAGS